VTKANRAKPHCLSFKAIGAGFAGPGAAGAQTVQVPGASKLGPGTYRVTLTATDATGHTVTQATNLTVKPKPKPKKKNGR
jgi:methionine-rich copper-binding protein CopC